MSIWAQGGSAESQLPIWMTRPTDSGLVIFLAESTETLAFVSGDDQGNLMVSGLLYSSGDCQSGCTKLRRVNSFAARTTQPTLDDMGEATLVGGVAHVALARDFANAIDPAKRYLVLLTPEGDAALYVTNRTQRSFDVREVGGGHTQVDFAYRVVAKPYGVADQRLPIRTAPTVVASAGR